MSVRRTRHGGSPASFAHPSGRPGNRGPHGRLDVRHLLSDLRFALRAWRNHPGFTAVAILSMALGIGANTAIFTLVDQVLLRLLPVKDPQQLVQLTMDGVHFGSNWRVDAESTRRLLPRERAGSSASRVSIGPTQPRWHDSSILPPSADLPSASRPTAAGCSPPRARQTPI